jgi:DNA topoisomerase IB
MLDSETRISVDVAMPAPAGLRYVCDDTPAIRRRRAGKGFVYLDAKGRLRISVRDEARIAPPRRLPSSA